MSVKWTDPADAGCARAPDGKASAVGAQIYGLPLGAPPGHIARHRVPPRPRRAWVARSVGALMGARWWIRTTVVVLLCGVASALATFVIVFLIATMVGGWLS